MRAAQLGVDVDLDHAGRDRAHEVLPREAGRAVQHERCGAYLGDRAQADKIEPDRLRREAVDVADGDGERVDARCASANSAAWAGSVMSPGGGGAGAVLVA